MSAESGFVQSWRVGPYTATLTMSPCRRGEERPAVIEWLPVLPKRLTPEELVEYRVGRDQALAALAESTGVRMLVFEV